MDISREDLRAAAADIKSDIKEHVDLRVGNVERRLDFLNGKVATQERKIWELEQLAPKGDEKPALTKREFKLVAYVAGAVAAVVEVGYRLAVFLAARP